MMENHQIRLAARPHGENALVVQLLTRERGRHAGLVRGGQVFMEALERLMAGRTTFMYLDE